MNQDTLRKLESFRYKKSKQLIPESTHGHCDLMTDPMTHDEQDIAMSHLDELVPDISESTDSWNASALRACDTAPNNHPSRCLMPYLERLDLHGSVEDAHRMQRVRGSTFSYYSLVVEYDSIQVSALLQCELFQVDVESLFVDAYRLWLEKTLRTHVNPETIFLHLVPVYYDTIHTKISSTMATSSDWHQAQGMVVQISLPTVVQMSYCYRCQNPQCRNQNVVLIRCKDGRFQIHHRDSTDVLLHQKWRSNIRKWDVLCQHCSSLMKECIKDGYQETQQRFRLFLAHEPGLFVKGCFL
jgi:hypothetical protein